MTDQMEKDIGDMVLARIKGVEPKVIYVDGKDIVSFSTNRGDGYG